jgi:hypothetical protein
VTVAVAVTVTVTVTVTVALTVTVAVTVVRAPWTHAVSHALCCRCRRVSGRHDPLSLSRVRTDFLACDHCAVVFRLTFGPCSRHCSTESNDLAFIETSALDSTGVETAFHKILTGELCVGACAWVWVWVRGWCGCACVCERGARGRACVRAFGLVVVVSPCLQYADGRAVARGAHLRVVLRVVQRFTGCLAART